MKKILISLLGLVAFSTHAANPSFKSLAWTNAAGVISLTGTNNKVVSIISTLPDNPTNVAMVVDTSVDWLNNSATLANFRNHGTNQLQISNHGAIGIGSSVSANYGTLGTNDGLVIIHSPYYGDGPVAKFYMAEVDDAYNNYAELEFVAEFTGGNDTLPVVRVSLSSYGVIPATWTIKASQDGDSSALTFSNPGTPLLQLRPSSSGGNLPYLFDTYTNHTGNLVEFSNQTTNKFTVGFDGAITTGLPNGAASAGSFQMGKENVISTVTNLMLRVDGVLYSIQATPR